MPITFSSIKSELKPVKNAVLRAGQRWKRMRGNYMMKTKGGFGSRSTISKYHGPESGNDVILRFVETGKPIMVSRIGKVELEAIIEWRYKQKGRAKRNTIIHKLWNNAGFFPRDEVKIAKFVDLYLHSIRDIDCFAAWNYRHGWFKEEERLYFENCSGAILIDLKSLNSFEYANPWTLALENKRVLVVHPFIDSIRSQYSQRELLFSDPRVLPKFSKLETVKAVQSIAGSRTDFRDWFEALSWMKDEIGRKEFDIAIIGAGAYGLPLASYVKRLGKQAVHMGGVTQILFGITGSRWDNKYANLINQWWVRPSTQETPVHCHKVEKGCYW